MSAEKGLKLTDARLRLLRAARDGQLRRTRWGTDVDRSDGGYETVTAAVRSLFHADWVRMPDARHGYAGPIELTETGAEVLAAEEARAGRASQ